MDIEIICPLYNGQKYINNIIKGINKQKNVNILRTFFILTNTNDESEKILKEKNLNYVKIEPKDFSHSLTREKYALKSKADIIVFISQDIEIVDKLWLYNLTRNIANEEVAAAYSKQITKYDNIEKYTRENNYPDYSRIVSIRDMKKLGLNTFFFSDASSAIKTKVFKKLNGYDNKNLPINEDMYFAYKLIKKGYKIKYASDSVVYHSHEFTLKELYNRYKLIGIFFKQNKYLEDYEIDESGSKLAKYILKRAIQEKNFKVLFRFLPDMSARYIGMKVGRIFGK
ncbi:MAG: glycosyltransferase family 2 protein [Bacilli bacterium]|nr:glycosyltransferase family 2 protein [Bacilli bacterium]